MITQIKLIFIYLLLKSLVHGQRVVTVAGSGSSVNSDGQGLTAGINRPHHIAIDANGTVYFVTDPSTACLVRRMTPHFSVSTIATIGIGWGVAVDLNGNVIAADGNSPGSIWRITPSGTKTTVATGFNNPVGVNVDSIGNIWVAETFNNRIMRINATGNMSVVAGGTQGTANGQGTSAQFHYPQHMVFDPEGQLTYVADTFNHLIRVINATGFVSTYGKAGGGSQDGPASEATFTLPRQLVIDSSGNLFLAGDDNKVRRINTTGWVSTIAGSGSPGSADGYGSQATFNSAIGIAMNRYGVIFIGDFYGNRIRMLTCDTPFCGAGSWQMGCDCVPCSAGFYQPSNGQSICLPCPLNTFQPSTGQSACLTCPAPGTCVNGTTLQCPSGYVRAVDGRTCIAAFISTSSQSSLLPTVSETAAQLATTLPPSSSQPASASLLPTSQTLSASLSLPPPPLPPKPDVNFWVSWWMLNPLTCILMLLTCWIFIGSIGALFGFVLTNRASTPLATTMTAATVWTIRMTDHSQNHGYSSQVSDASPAPGTTETGVSLVYSPSCSAVSRAETFVKPRVFDSRQ